MNQENIIGEIKASIIALIKEKYNEKSNEIENEIDFFLAETRGDFFRWSELLANQKITNEEFKLLLLAKKDVFVINQLHQLGISKISLGHFKNKIIDIVFNVVITAIL